MLKKLIKYDLIWVNKSMSTFFIIALIISTLTRISSNFTSSFVGNIIYLILKGLTIGILVSLMINCIIRIWVRFRLNLYKDESYLTHTLPVKKQTLYNSKIISSIISLLISSLVILICIVVAFFDQSMIDRIKDIFNQSGSSIVFISVIITMLLELFYATLCGIIGLVIGHKSNNGKMPKSIIVGILLYFAIQFISFIVIIAVGLANENMRGLFNNQMANDLNFETAVKTLEITMNLVYTVFIIGLYFVGEKLFKKGVNVD